VTSLPCCERMEHMVAASEVLGKGKEPTLDGDQFVLEY
jgi:hypothetical protein